jgi:hypothetical protein
MAITDRDVELAEARMQALRDAGHAVSARYDRRAARIVVDLNTGVQFAVPARSIEGLAEAASDDLSQIDISPSGLGLAWPTLDVDVYVPALLQGVFGSKRWMAALLGASGGRVSSAAKTEAARRNGQKGGRPKRVSAA